jgi:hypothetical protein
VAGGAGCGLPLRNADNGMWLVSHPELPGWKLVIAPVIDRQNLLLWEPSSGAITAGKPDPTELNILSPKQ